MTAGPCSCVNFDMFGKLSDLLRTFILSDLINRGTLCSNNGPRRSGVGTLIRSDFLGFAVLQQDVPSLAAFPGIAAHLSHLLLINFSGVYYIGPSPSADFSWNNLELETAQLTWWSPKKAVRNHVHPHSWMNGSQIWDQIWSKFVCLSLLAWGKRLIGVTVLMNGQVLFFSLWNHEDLVGSKVFTCASVQLELLGSISGNCLCIMCSHLSKVEQQWRMENGVESKCSSVLAKIIFVHETSGWAPPPEVTILSSDLKVVWVCVTCTQPTTSAYGLKHWWTGPLMYVPHICWH